MELSYNLVTFLQNLNPISLSVIFILLFMSVLSWYLIIVKMFQLAFTNLKANNVLKLSAPLLNRIKILQFREIRFAPFPKQLTTT